MESLIITAELHQLAVYEEQQGHKYPFHIHQIKVSISRPVRERRHIGNLRSAALVQQYEPFENQSRSREERGERVVVSGYDIRKKDQGVEKNLNTDKSSITVSVTTANDVLSHRVSDK